jgi:catechol 2,3-dioxygenase-like lactoylglutathione lyase family enzyme
VVTFASAAPILPVRDFDAACERYTRMGFDVKRHDNGTEYGFAARDGVHLHLAHSTWHDPRTSSVMVYVYVDDADGLHAAWAAADVGGRLHAPVDTDYGLREGAYVDPDGNLLRFGSPLP